MPTKQEALQIIISLIKEHSIKLSEITDALKESHVATHNHLKKFFAFIGGIFIFSGLAIYIGEHWISMNSAARIIITLGSGIALLVLALLALNNKNYEKNFMPLYIVAVIFETNGIFVTLNELFPETSNWHLPALLVSGTMLLQQIILFSTKHKTVFLFMIILFGFIFSAVLLDQCGIQDRPIAIILGTSLISISYGLDKIYVSIKPFWYLVGSVLLLLATFDLLRGTSFEVFYIGVCCFFIYLSTIAHSRMLLFTSTVAMLAYISYFTGEHFAHSIGWPIALIILGFVMLFISSIALRIGKRIK